MSENGIRNIFKYSSIVCIALSAAMLFFGGVGIKDSEKRAGFCEQIDQLIDNISAEQEEDNSYQEEMLAQLGVQIDLNGIYEKTKQVCRVIRDGKISASEAAFTAPDLISLIEMVTDNEFMGMILGDRLDEYIGSLDDTKSILVAVVVLFWATLACAVVMIILHFLNSRLPGITFTVLNLVWLVAFIYVKSGINGFIEEKSPATPPVIKIFAAPVVGFISAAVALALWIIKDKVAAGNTVYAVPVQQMGNAGYAGPMQQAGYAAPVQPMNNTGYASPVQQPVNTGYAAPVQPMGNAGYAAPVQPTGNTGYIGGYSQADVRFCPKCGAPLDPDYDFCGSCGFRIVNG